MCYALREHPAALEADLARFYGVDLSEFWRGGVSLRRLASLVYFLPAGGAVWAAQNGVPYGWTLTDILVTDLFHALTGEAHPARPSGGRSSRDVAGIRARLEEQRARLSRGEGLSGV